MRERAEQELMTSLRPSLNGLITLLTDREERRQAGDPREGSARELMICVLDHMRKVLRLQLFVCNSLAAGSQSGVFGMGLVWEGVQMELQVCGQRCDSRARCNESDTLANDYALARIVVVHREETSRFSAWR